MDVLIQSLYYWKGPYNINGVPLRRVNQAYVIATSTRVNVSSVNVPETINDEYFRRQESSIDRKKSAKNLLGEKGKEEKRQLPETRVNDQKNLDSQLTPLIEKVPLLKDYLNSRFSLRKGQYPHQLKF